MHPDPSNTAALLALAHSQTELSHTLLRCTTCLELTLTCLVIGTVLFIRSFRG